MNHKNYPILIVDPAHTAEVNNSLFLILEQLEQKGLSFIAATSAQEGLERFMQHSELSCILFEWEATGKNPEKTISTLREKNEWIPIFIMTQKHKLKDISTEVLSMIDGYLWKTEDTPHFIAGRIDQAAEGYIQKLLPPFFKTLVNYVETYKYSWHTPGHSGGLAFLKSPIGHLFYNFFGENVFRADLSVSVPDLGSLMEHTSVNGEAEKLAAKNFGADYTYFVTNGTSTANKIVANATITDGDLVLVDRNCHKSLQHALTLTGAIPIYFIPSRNDYGIIGGIPQSEFKQNTITKKIQDNPLAKQKDTPIKLAVVTNSTYDGLIYDVVAIKSLLAKSTSALHFDEAWYAYAKFHPIYENRFAMCKTHKINHPTIYATQSTHKLLAAFSQASMIHIRQGEQPIEPSQFNEAFMMHTSTSPQYNIIASLDVASKMMEGNFGKALMQEAIDEAVAFRNKMIQIKTDQKSKKKNNWWFSIWQPNKISKESKSWELTSSDTWHGYKKIDDRFMMLDPIKVTILTPGILKKGTFEKEGIPAPIVARFLMKHGIVDEKTGFYSFLTLFSMGITKGKSSVLLSALFDFKEAFDQNISLEQVFPDLCEKYPQVYASMTLQDLAHKMHNHLKNKNIIELTYEVFSYLPHPKLSPKQAYEKLVRGQAKNVPIDEIKDQTLAVMLVPYPPGIPIIMPGEQVTDQTSSIIEYFKALESYDNMFPGFETETHGIEVKDGLYYTKVLVD